MSDDKIEPQDDEFYIAQDDSGKSDKEKAAAQTEQGGTVAQEDPSRSTLHYGDQETAEPDRVATENTLGSTDHNPETSSDNETVRTSAETETSINDASTNTSGPQGTSGTQPNNDRANGDGAPPNGSDAQARPTAENSQTGIPQQSPNSASIAAQNAKSSDRDESIVDGSGNNGEPAPPPENQAPSDISLEQVSFDENQEGAVVGRLSVSDEDDVDGHAFSVSDDRFEVVAGEVRLKSGVSLDHETDGAISFHVTAIDPSGASVTQKFEITANDVNEGPAGISLGARLVATDQEGATVGQITVVDPDRADVHQFSLSDDRFEVVGGHLKLRDDATLTQDDIGTTSVDVTVTDQGGATYSETLTFDVLDVAETSFTSGFHASYFDVDHSLRELDQIDWTGSPTHEEVVGGINYQNSSNSFWDGGSKDTFGARITGNIDVEEGGTFEFFLGGDDGAVLFIDGVEVIDNDGLHGFRTRTGDVELEPGTHTIEVRYFENYGHAGLKLEWEGPGIDGRELVTSPNTANLQTVNGVPLTLDVNIAHPDGIDVEAVTQVIDSLPEGTVVQAGDFSAQAGPEGSVDISQWDTSLLTLTTPISFTGDVNAKIVTTTSAENGGEISTITDLDFAVSQADISPPVTELQTGFRASYFDVDHSLNRLDQIDWSGEPTQEEIVGEINYRNSTDSFWEGGSRDTFGTKITGDIDVTETGTFEFFLGGDDGAILFIDGVEVIDNDGLHGYRTRTGEIELEPGTHSIEVRYFENYGHAGLKLEWEGPGIEGRELVSANDDLVVAENGVFAVTLDTTDVSDAANIQISGLPADTILMSDDNVAVSDGGEVDLSGWDLSLLEIAPPPGFVGTINGEVTTTGKAFNGQDVEGISNFSIDVGDVYQTSSEENDDTPAELWADSGEGTTQGSWTDAPDDQSNGDEQDQDVMDEPVEEQFAADQSHETNETYERQDW